MDQHMHSAVVNALVRHGVNVLTAHEAQRCGQTDAEQLAFATKEQRVLVTFDTDFLALHQTGVAHAGIAWCPATKYSIGQLIQALLLVHGVLHREAMCNHLEYL
jgi:predicted nuclease of predicted toxin-antitoxin system